MRKIFSLALATTLMIPGVLASETNETTSTEDIETIPYPRGLEPLPLI